MSEWAIGDGDTEERTAYEYREFYLDHGFEFKPFTCPFCGVPLTAINVYTEEEVARRPHFRADKGPHRFGCDGYPIATSAKDRGPPRRRVEKREFLLPEMLVPRRSPAVVRPARGRLHPTVLPDEHEVKRRRKRAAESLGPAVYRTSLIRSVATAYLGVLRESYKLKDEKRWTETQRRGWVTDLFKENQLTLYDGYTLTYHGALRNTRFPPPDKPRIFHGSATVGRVSQSHMSAAYVLTPDTPVEHRQDDQVMRYPVEVLFRSVYAGEPTGSQRHTLERLDRAADAGLVARWFAYGVLHLQDDEGVYRMTVDEVDHLYLHRLEKPVVRG